MGNDKAWAFLIRLLTWLLGGARECHGRLFFISCFLLPRTILLICVKRGHRCVCWGPPSAKEERQPPLFLPFTKVATALCWCTVSCVSGGSLSVSVVLVPLAKTLAATLSAWGGRYESKVSQLRFSNEHGGGWWSSWWDPQLWHFWFFIVLALPISNVGSECREMLKHRRFSPALNKLLWAANIPPKSILNYFPIWRLFLFCFAHKCRRGLRNIILWVPHSNAPWSVALDTAGT